MKTILFFLPILLMFNSFAQNKKPIIEFCPLCLVDDASYPTIQAGIEFYLSERLRLYSEIGIKYRKGEYETVDTNFLNSKGFKLKTELRYLVETNNRVFKNLYIAVNAFYNNEFHNTEIGYYYQHDSSTLRIDNFGVKKKVFGINLLIGWKKTIWKRFSFDGYVGLGGRFLKISTVNKEADINRDDLDLEKELTIAGVRIKDDFDEGNNFSRNLTLGIRLCYKL